MSKTPTYDSLRPKYRAFLDEYMLDFNGKRAAIAAGYTERSSESTASHILSLPKVKQALAELEALRRERTEEKREKSAEWVIQQLEALVEDALEAKDRSNANRSLELLGRYHQLFTDKLQINKEKPEELEEAELVRLAKQGAQQTEQRNDSQVDNDEESTGYKH